MESRLTTTPRRILIVGNRGGTNVGGCFERAANAHGSDVRLMESWRAMDAPPWLRRLNWYLRGRRPTRLYSFSEAVYAHCVEWLPDVLLTTGIAPVRGETLSRIRSLGVTTVNYLTDDPWNPAHYAPWFIQALNKYHFVFSPRRSNLDDLRAAGCDKVDYLPFAYDPSIHFWEPPAAGEYQTDIVFVGGCDESRIPYCRALLQAGLRLSLYGDYWDRHIETRSSFRGYAGIEVLRMATAAAKISLCLVRKGNRDGHVMRTFETAAMGGCMLAEDTEEHRELFGADGETVVYFRSATEMVDRAKWLLNNDAERRRLTASAHARITHGHHTYADRLVTMLERAFVKTSFLTLQ